MEKHPSLQMTLMNLAGDKMHILMRVTVYSERIPFVPFSDITNHHFVTEIAENIKLIQKTEAIIKADRMSFLYVCFYHFKKIKFRYV